MFRKGSGFQPPLTKVDTRIFTASQEPQVFLLWQREMLLSVGLQRLCVSPLSMEVLVFSKWEISLCPETWIKGCGGLTLAGHKVPTKPPYHSAPQLDRGEKI